MNHIVKSYPLTNISDNNLLDLRSAGNNAVTWLTDVAIKALVQ